MSLYDSIEPTQRPDGGWFGYVARNVPSLTSLMYVILPSFDDSQEFGPCRWQSRDSSSLPTKGDEVLVLFDDRRQPWVVAWWPYN